jgi:hypothetical protein
MRRQVVVVWALVSSALMLVGAFGPWVTALGIVSIAGTDFEKHGWYLAALALLGAAVAWFRRFDFSGGGTAIAIGLAGAALSFHDRHRLDSALSQAGAIGHALVHVGWGLDAALVGSISLALSGVGWFVTDVEDAPVGRTEVAAALNVPTIPAGWYRDPNDESLLRYWNGFGWTTQTAKPAS